MLVDLAQSLAAAALVLVVPGPTNTLLAAAGAAAPGRPPLHLALAELAGYLVAIACLATVGELLARAVPAAVPVLRLAVAAYLILLGCCLWQSGEAGPAAQVVTARRILIATLFNPKAAIFAFALMPAERDWTLALWFAGFACVVLAAGSAWILLGHRITRHFGRGVGLLVPKAASLALFAFAALLAERTVAALV